MKQLFQDPKAGTIQIVDLPPPALGEHTEETLLTLGLEAQAIERLRASGIAC